jgi:hypothetical protein
MTSAATPATPGRFRMVGLSGMAVSFAALVAAAGGLPVARSQTSDQGLQPMTAATHQPGETGKAAACATCGVVEAVRMLELRAEPPGGDKQKPSGTRTSYRVTVKMADGSYRTLAQPTPPAVGVGDRVRVADGAVVRDH